jgi:ABC-type branched-subunit amino acid transport system substrate-binding protein
MKRGLTASHIRRASGVVVVTVMLVLAGCSRSDSDSSSTSTTSGSTPAAAPASSASFGTLKDVCQKGSGNDASDTGVTSDSIKVATFSDAGATIRPGLNQELFDAADVFSKWCNDHGGINGRRIEVVKEDAALFNVPAKMTDACQQKVFFLVGGGAAFDDTGEKTRLECLIPSVPGYVATPESRGADLTVQPVPNPNSGMGNGQFKWLAKKYPDSVDQLGVITADVPTTKTISDQSQEAAEGAGFKAVYSDKYPAAGTVSWTPYVAAMKDKDVKGLIFTGEPETLAALEQTMKDQNYEPEWIEAAANIYDEGLVKIGKDAIRNTYIVTTFPPFEAAASNPATEQYLKLFQEYLPNGKSKALLGAQGFSGWLLFAQAAKECGADLTRRCVYDNLKKVHQWTGGGLHAETDPGAGTPSECFAMIEASPSGFRLAKIGANSGIYDCSRGNTYKFKKSYGEGATLAGVGKSLADLK